VKKNITLLYGFSFFDQFMIVLAVWAPYLATARLRARLLPPQGLSLACLAHLSVASSHVSPECLAYFALFETRATSSSSLESNSFRTGD
jgi:glucose-6-phosphate-specific signal transduction histidine kinase